MNKYVPGDIYYDKDARVRFVVSKRFSEYNKLIGKHEDYIEIMFLPTKLSSYFMDFSSITFPLDLITQQQDFDKYEGKANKFMYLIYLEE